MADQRRTEKLLPVLVGLHEEHVMAKATIEQTAATRDPSTSQILEPEKVVITVVATGLEARLLGDFVASGELVALSFSGLPIHPRKSTPRDIKENL